MKLTIANHLYIWDPVNWLYHLFLYGKFKKKTLDRTMHWHDILSDFIDTIPEEVPPRLYNNLQEMRRDIGHYRIDLMSNRLDRMGFDFEADKGREN